MSNGGRQQVIPRSAAAWPGGGATWGGRRSARSVDVTSNGYEHVGCHIDGMAQGRAGRASTGRASTGRGTAGGSLLESVLDLLAGLLEFPLAWSALPSASICSLPIAAPVSFLTLPLTSVTLFAALFSADIGDARRPAASPPGASRLG